MRAAAAKREHSSFDARVTDSTAPLVCCCHSFLAMPVLSASDGRLVSYIDMLDLVWYTLWSFGAWRAEVSREDIMESRAHFGEYLQLDRFRNATVLDCIGRSGFGTRNQATHVYKGFSLFHVFETMARINAHRIGQRAKQHAAADSDELVTFCLWLTS